MQKHTPGPWRLKDNDWTVIEGKREAGVPYLFTLAETLGYKQEREANARLIASAPELLEALKNVERMSGELLLQDGTRGTDKALTLLAAIDSANEVIRRATGE